MRLSGGRDVDSALGTNVLYGGESNTCRLQSTSYLLGGISNSLELQSKIDRIFAVFRFQCGGQLRVPVLQAACAR